MIKKYDKKNLDQQEIQRILKNQILVRLYLLNINIKTIAYVYILGNNFNYKLLRLNVPVECSRDRGRCIFFFQ